MKIAIDDIQVAVENELDLAVLVHSIITALETRSKIRDNDLLEERGAQLAREMNAGVLHIAYDALTSTQEAMELIKNQEALQQNNDENDPGPDSNDSPDESVYLRL